MSKQLVLALMFLFPCFARSETPPRCVNGGYPLRVAETWVREQKPVTTLTLLRNCPIGFPLDAHAIETLTAAQASPAVMDLLNQKTAPLLSLDQAHSQADEIERRIGSAKNTDTLTAFRERVALLKQRLYADPRPIGTYRYDAALTELFVTLGAEEYVFWPVDSAAESALSGKWREVKVVQPYDEDADRSRTLTLASPPVTQKGMPVPIFRAHVEEERYKLAEAAIEDVHNLMRAGEFDKAVQLSTDVSQLKPTWEIRNDKLIDALKRLDLANKAGVAAKQNADAFRAKGEWLDLGTPAHLIWTTADNGQDINWKDAGKYCKSLQTGGATGWRLPTLAELEGIEDKSQTSATAPTPTDFFFQTPAGKLDRIPKGTKWDYHIAGKISLSTGRVWSSTFGGSGGVLFTSFIALESTSSPQAEKRFLRALCVREGEQTP